MLPAKKVRRQLHTLIEGGFVVRSVNVLAFGKRPKSIPINVARA